MQQPKLAKWLVIGALAAFGVLAGGRAAVAQEATPEPTVAPAAAPADPTVQGSNSSSDATASGSGATSSNGATVNAGPQASGSGGMSSQIGNNSVTVVQKSEARSGDAVAGSQIVGVVGGNATIQGSNSSTGATATSGAATATNSATVNAGPWASATGTGSANAQQIGDNSVEVVQESVAITGSSIAGSQVTGIVGSDGDAVVQNSNASTDATSISGIADASNEAFINSGPFSTSVDGSSDVQQVGDNDAVLSQSAHASSGDALAGAQVTGGVVGGGTVQGSNSSTDPEAIGGAAVASNLATVNAGPTGTPTGDGSVQVQQNGDNSVDADQSSTAHSGDAVAGSQVTGLVSAQRGHLTVQNQQSSDRPVAITASASATNDLDATSGPTGTGTGTVQVGQIGDNDVAATQSAEAVSGDAVAGSQVTGTVGGGDVTVQNSNSSTSPVAIGGRATASNLGTADAGAYGAGGDGSDVSVSQIGDNSADLVQDTWATSGDAVAGSQVVGVVDGHDVTVQSNNSSSGRVAIGGPATATTDGLVTAGAVATTSGAGTASAQQIGDNDSSLDQASVATSGDAVAGGAVFGVIGHDVTIQGSNNSTGAVAIGGPAVSTVIGDVNAGPSATSVDGDASVSQVGDNSTDTVQSSVATSGDAVAGSMVVGVISNGGDSTIQLTNVSDGSVAISGEATATADATVQSGPSSDSTGTGTSTASQIGDNSIDFDQFSGATSGDAVSGSVVVGQVGSSDTTVQLGNASTGDTAITADAIAVGEAAGNAGPASTNGSATQNGDNDINATQDTEVVSGDAVAGSQIVGTV